MPTLRMLRSDRLQTARAELQQSVWRVLPDRGPHATAVVDAILTAAEIYAERFAAVQVDAIIGPAQVAEIVAAATERNRRHE